MKDKTILGFLKKKNYYILQVKEKTKNEYILTDGENDICLVSANTFKKIAPKIRKTETRNTIYPDVFYITYHFQGVYNEYKN